MSTMQSSVSSLSNVANPQPPAWLSGPFRPPSADVTSKSSSPSASVLPPHLLLPDGTPDYLRLILSADIYDLVKATPLERATNLSTRLGCQVLMKREDLQPVFSFKIRGAFNMMRSLPDEQKWKGVVACSAGNHAQGVALSGAHLSIPCTIVMPLGTPSIKTANVRRLGAKVVLHGQDFDAAKAECYRLAQAHGLAVIPPFDDPRVIAGQGTVAVEICRQTDMTKLDAVFCCVGGGGLLAGVAAYVKRIAPPHVKVIGVETFDADALSQSLEKGERVTLNEVGLFSDGTAVKIVGEECFRVCQGLVDGMVRVDTDEICAAIRDIFEETRSVPEPAGALAVAGMKRYVAQHNLFGSDKRFAVLVSGANFNFSRLRFVAERAELGDQREVLLMVEIPEKAGSFLKLYSHIHPRAITEFSYRLNDAERAHIYLSFSLLGAPAGATPVAPPVAAVAAAATSSTKTSSSNINGDVVGGPTTTSSIDSLTRSISNARLSTPPTGAPISSFSSASASASAGTVKEQEPLPTQSAARASELATILSGLEAEGMTARDISGNEMAKSHARYMVGGRKEVENERVFQFTFPERPGSLQRFLTGLNAGWNISLFNYRNAGGDTANILAGIQVPEEEEGAFGEFLEELVMSGYAWTEETDNVVYRRFLRG